MLTVDQCKNTKVIPYALYGGKVYSFSVWDKYTMTFDGEDLRIGTDNKVYIVFASEVEAMEYENTFANCELCCFGGYMNAYCLSI